jgi:putative PIN family toxin of toxin-antitoxin system
MLLVVAIDTNVVISGLLWSGSPRSILEFGAHKQRIQIITTETLVDELRDVLQRPKFSKRLAKLQTTPERLIEQFLSYTVVVTPAEIESPIVLRDQDDDAVIACALGGSATLLVSGDSDLLSLGSFRDIKFVSPQTLLQMLTTSNDPDETTNP